MIKSWENKKSDVFCFCGLPADLMFDGEYRCLKHIKKVIKAPKRKDFSGKSKTPFGGYEKR